MPDFTPEQKESFDLAMESYHDSSNWMVELVKDWVEWVKAYNVYTERPTKEEEGKKARMARPHIHSAVEHAVSKVLSPITSQVPIVRALPVEESDTTQAELNELLLHHQFTKAQLRFKLESWLRNRAIFGFAPVYPYWRFDSYISSVREPIQVQDPYTGAFYTIGFGQPQDKEIVVFEGPDFDVGDVEDFFGDPSSRSFTQMDMRYVVRRYYRSWEWLKRRADFGFIDKKQFNEIRENEPCPPRDTQAISDFKVREFFLSTQTDQSLNKGVVEILEYMSKERVITIANRKALLRTLPNPHPGNCIPAIIAIRLPFTNWPWGKGYVEPIIRTWYHLNSLSNARLDNLALIINKMWKMRKNSVDKSQIRSIPNHVIEMLGELDDLQPIDMPDVTQSVYQEEIVLKQGMDMATSQNEISRGGTPASVRSGTQTLALMEAITERFQMDINSFVDSGLIPLAQYFHRLNQQHITEDQVIRILGPEGIKWSRISPEDIYKEYDFTVDAAVRTVPKAVEAEQLLNLLGGLTPLFEGFPDMLISLYGKAAKKMGQFELALSLNKMVEAISQAREQAGGRFVDQGAAGGTGGARTARANAPGLENIIRSVATSIES